MLRTLAQALLPRALAQCGAAAAYDGAIAVACSSGTFSSSSNSGRGGARRGGGGGGAAGTPAPAAAAAAPCACARCRSIVGSTRAVHTSAAARHGGDKAPPGETISVTFVDKDGAETAVRAPLGKSLLEVAHDNDVELEGACEGSLACSTCHVILEADQYAKLDEPCEDELDMLDLAFGLTPTSRLGCQVVARRELDGMRVRLPSATRNFYVGDALREREAAAAIAAASAAASAPAPATAAAAAAAAGKR